jgi:Na+/proline symporter
MSSTSSELNALASTTTIDLYKRSFRTQKSDAHYLSSSKWFTLLWGILAILFATTASLFENLIQAVNLLGSLFYGTILGIFLVAFYVHYVKGQAVFMAALIAEAVVLYIHWMNAEGTAPQWLTMGYLWYNVVGCLLVVGIGILIQRFTALTANT